MQAVAAKKRDAPPSTKIHFMELSAVAPAAEAQAAAEALADAAPARIKPHAQHALVA